MTAMQLIRLIASSTTVTTLVALASFVAAETHTVVFTNNCGFDTPTLVQNGNILSTGENFTINGPLISAIAYLQNGNCGLNGEDCTLLGTTLRNPTTPGSGSSTCINLSPPNTFSVATGFGYFNGCDGAGFDCTNPDCSSGFLGPGGACQFPVACEADNVNLAITFCD